MALLAASTADPTSEIAQRRTTRRRTRTTGRRAYVPPSPGAFQIARDVSRDGGPRARVAGGRDNSRRDGSGNAASARSSDRVHELLRALIVDDARDAIASAGSCDGATRGGTSGNRGGRRECRRRRAADASARATTARPRRASPLAAASEGARRWGCATRSRDTRRGPRDRVADGRLPRRFSSWGRAANRRRTGRASRRSPSQARRARLVTRRGVTRRPRARRRGETPTSVGATSPERRDGRSRDRW